MATFPTTLLPWTIAALCAAPAPQETAPAGATPAPVELTEAHKVEVRRRLASAVESLRPNVVQISIEQSVAEGVFVSLEASGLVVDPGGHVVTIGSPLEQAGRVAVRFANFPRLRPRRAIVVGIDDPTDVAVLCVGPITLPALDLTTPAAPPQAALESRYVVTLFGVRDDRGERDARVALGWLHDPLQNPTFGRRRYERLLQVTTARLPQGAGGVLAQQDGRVVGLMLSPAMSGVAATAGDWMLALPVETLRRGVESVLARAEPTPPPAARPRAWIGFGATDLDEPEFLRHLGVAHAVVVSEVFDASPALAAGLAPHDLIVGWNGEPIRGVDELHERLAACAAGGEVALDCVSGLDRRSVKVTLGAW